MLLFEGMKLLVTSILCPPDLRFLLLMIQSEQLRVRIYDIRNRHLSYFGSAIIVCVIVVVQAFGSFRQLSRRMVSYLGWIYLPSVVLGRWASLIGLKPLFVMLQCFLILLSYSLVCRRINSLMPGLMI